MSEFDKFQIGEKYVFQKKITEADAAHNYGGKGLSNLFATPGLVGMVIDASVGMLDKRLSEGYITIGNEVGITHLNPTKVGETVTLEMSIHEIQQDNHCIFLKFTAFDEIGLIAEGVHLRTIVNQEVFLKRAEDRIKPLGI